MRRVLNKTRAWRARTAARRAQFARWMFYSKRNLVMAIVGGFFALMFLSTLASIANAYFWGGDARAQNTAQTTPAPSSDPSHVGTDDHDHGMGTRAEAEEAARTRADEFLRAWLDTSDPDTWRENVEPFTASSLGAALNTTELDQLPKATVKSMVVTASDPFAMTVLATLTDGIQLEVELGYDGTEWLVVSYQPPASADR